jgi:transketolase
LPVGRDSLPPAFLAQLRKSRRLMVVEEHVAQGGAGQMLAHVLMLCGETPSQFSHRYALGYPGGCYGSQVYHRRECGLDPAAILAELTQ